MKLLAAVEGALALAAPATAATRGPNVSGGVMTGATDFAGSTREHLAPPGTFLSTTSGRVGWCGHGLDYR